MGMPNWTCPDGRTGGPVCKQARDGSCGWTVVRCPHSEIVPTPVATATVELTRPPTPRPSATPVATRSPPPSGKVLGTAADAGADACAKPCSAGKTRRGIIRCVDSRRAALGVAGAINCPGVSVSRPNERRPLACEGFVAETACAGAGECLKMDGTCCDDDGSLVQPSGSLGNMYCGSPGQRCSRCKCLPGDALIATPDGDRPLRALALGDVIWTQTHDGVRVPAPVVELANVPAPPGHRLLELVLEDGRVVRGSPTHPSADGTPLEDLAPGTWLDGSRVRKSRLLPAGIAATHDVLPGGDTGIYWVNGVRLRSTIPPTSGFWSADASDR